VRVLEMFKALPEKTNVSGLINFFRLALKQMEPGELRSSKE
jgi:hypothetical protein